MNNHYVAIMAGGVGSRFWPGSREDRPKQFLDILGVGKSLLRLTYERFARVFPDSHIFIVTHAQYVEQVQKHLPELALEQIIAEPSRNNTAPCIAYTAFKLAQQNPAANFVVAPSDHIILREELFLEKVKQGLDFVSQNDALLTLGIEPTHPNTGYGYINFTEEQAEKGIFKVKQFTEKPNASKAKAFLEAGTYLWNAGIFIWNVQNILRAFKKHEPQLFDIFEEGRALFNGPQEQAFIQKAYPNCPKISIDYAIMENASNIYTLPADIGWSDLGTWASLHQQVERDEQNNTANTPHLLALDSNNCLIRVQNDKLVVLKDLHDYIIVEEDDVLLIFPKNKEQEIKQVRTIVSDKFGERFI